MNSTVFFRAARVLIAPALLCASSYPAMAQTCADHGIPVNGFPSWQERATLVLTNACRIAPTNFRDTYLPSAPTILQPSAYPAVAPLQWVLGLNQSSRVQSIDLATTSGCGFQHNSCDGTLWNTRIAVYYPSYSSLGENIAAGYSDPLTTVNGWLLDTVNGVPSADGAPTDGHRRNIMSAGFTQLGCGFATGPNPYTRYWTEDFGRPQVAAAICSPIAAGSHLFQTGVVSFLATYYDALNTAPQSASIVINGVSSPMALHLGTPARGTYRLTSPLTSSCRSYHFDFRDASGGAVRYPARGELRTFGEGGCTEDYTPPTTPPPCAADFDGSGALSVSDIFTFISAWFAADPRANFNTVGGLTVDDIFAFLNAWFAAC
jgi:hypothetical protein